MEIQGIQGIQDFVKESKEDIKEIISERLKNPLINYYIFFLVIYNWDIILYTSFSSSTIEIKLDCIKEIYHNSDICWIFNWRFIAPLLYSIVSLFLFQLLSLIIDRFYNKLIIKRYVLYCNIEEGKATEYRRVIDARTGNKQIEDLEIENISLKNIIETQKLEFSEFAKNNLSEVKSNKSEIDTLESEISLIVLDGLTSKPSLNNGEFNLVDYILNYIKSSGPYTENELLDEVEKGVDLYFFENNKYKIAHQPVHFKALLKKNVKNLVKYLFSKDLIHYNKVLSESTGKNYYN
ncbi:hypothetical protein ACTS9D_00770 [Empedobacter brevis]